MAAEGKQNAAQANSWQLRHILDSSTNGMAMVWQRYDVMTVKAAVNGSINRPFLLTFFMLISAYKSCCRLADLRIGPVYLWGGGWLKVV